MPAPRTAPKDAARGPRRLTREARRAQLVEAALPVIAQQGLNDFSLDDVVARADVTRNLVYHYFPRGRADLVLAVAELAGHQLTDDWVVDESVPLPERLAGNVGRMIAHASQPSPAWTIYRLAQASSDPKLAETVERFTEVVISSIALNQVGTAEPPPRLRLALRGYLAFFTAVLDGARAASTPPDELLGLLNETLVGVVRAASL